MVKSLANEFEVKEIKQKQNEVQMPKLEKAPTSITVQLSLVPGFHMPNFFLPEQLTTVEALMRYRLQGSCWPLNIWA